MAANDVQSNYFLHIKLKYRLVLHFCMHILRSIMPVMLILLQLLNIFNVKNKVINNMKIVKFLKSLRTLQFLSGKMLIFFTWVHSMTFNGCSIVVWAKANSLRWPPWHFQNGWLFISCNILLPNLSSKYAIFNVYTTWIHT